MQKVKVFGKSISVPNPFRINKKLGTSDRKVKIPKKSKLMAVGITAEQFCQELSNYFDDEYSLNGVDFADHADWRIKRGYVFITVTSMCDC